MELVNHSLHVSMTNPPDLLVASWAALWLIPLRESQYLCPCCVCARLVPVLIQVWRKRDDAFNIILLVF